jgi:hypothetical protein
MADPSTNDQQVVSPVVAVEHSTMPARTNGDTGSTNGTLVAHRTVNGEVNGVVNGDGDAEAEGGDVLGDPVEIEFAPKKKKKKSKSRSASKRGLVSRALSPPEPR